MAKEPQEFASVQKCCTRCGSSNTKFKYLNNGKITQPRYRCQDCKSYFQVINHNRKTPTKYLKPKHKDPHELQGLLKVCSSPSCGAQNNATFKYYNNKSKCGLTQPRFKCLSCGKDFQMSFEGGQLLPSKHKKAPPSPQASTSTYEQGVGYEQQTNSFFNIQDGTLSETNNVEVDLAFNNGGEYFNTQETKALDTTLNPFYGEYLYIEELETPKTSPIQFHNISNDPSIGCASGYDITQDPHLSFNQSSFDANVASFAKDHDVGKYSCVSDYPMINEEQLWTSTYGATSGIQEDEFLNSNGISNDIAPMEHGDIAQTNIEYDMGSLEHFDPMEQYHNIDAMVDQFSNTIALAMEQSDVRESLWIEDMEEATTIPFPISEQIDSVDQYYDIDAMIDQFPSANALAMEQNDISKCLSIEDMVAATTIIFPIPDFGDMIEPKEDYYKEDVIDCLWE